MGMVTPIGHWSLRGRIDTQPGSLLSATPSGNLTLLPDGALFDGRSAQLAIGDSAQRFQGSFTLATRIWIDADAPENIGSIASKYNHTTRTGFELSIIDHGGMTCASANYRNLSFSADTGTLPQWEDCGQCGDAIYIGALTVHNGHLYASTCEHGENKIGRVFRYVGGQQWEDTHLPCKANSAYGMASINNVLYVASGLYDVRGSQIHGAGNLNTETRMWRMESDGIWRDCGAPAGIDEDLFNVGIYRGKLYVTPSYSPGLFRYEGGTTWTPCAAPYPRLLSLAQWRGHLYGGGNRSHRRNGPPPERKINFTILPDADGVYRYDDITDLWQPCGAIEEETQMYGFVPYYDRLCTATWPNGKVFDSASGIGWEDMGRLHPNETEVMAMGLYNSNLYAGTLPAADIFRYDGNRRWTRVGNVDNTPDVIYRRAWTMAVYGDGLYVGTLPSGRVHKMTVGNVATDGHQLTTGWHHIAAVRDGGQLRIYLDGRQCAESKTGNTARNLANDVSLTIGKGSHGPFQGKMADLQLYDRALDALSIAKLSGSTTAQPSD